MFGATLKAVLDMQNNETATQNQDCFVPAANVWTGKDKITVCVELPGMGKDQISITLNNRTLTVAGERKAQADENQTRYIRQRAFGKFSRSIKLPEKTDTQNISANYENGVLTIVLPQVNNSKTIEVKVD